jgi:hypothetical protein
LWHANLHKNGRFLTSPVWKHGLWSQVDGWTVPFSIYVNDGRGRSLGDPGWNVLDPLSVGAQIDGMKDFAGHQQNQSL